MAPRLTTHLLAACILQGIMALASLYMAIRIWTIVRSGKTPARHGYHWVAAGFFGLFM